jgi:hypothetical protein
MKRRLFLTSLAIAALASLVFAAAKPNFSGTWTMDQKRTYGLPQNMSQTLTIKQTDNQIDLETKIVQPNNERTVKDTYILDGKEYDYTPAVAPNQTPPKGKRSAVWLPGDRGIQVTEVITTETPKGPAQSQTVRKWTISSAGELVIDMYIDNANGSFETKRIFIKQ